MPCRRKLLFDCSPIRATGSTSMACIADEGRALPEPEAGVRHPGRASRAQDGTQLIAVLVHRDAPTGRIMRHEPGFAAYIDWSNEAKRQVISTDAKWVCPA